MSTEKKDEMLERNLRSLLSLADEEPAKVEPMMPKAAERIARVAARSAAAAESRRASRGWLGWVAAAVSAAAVLGFTLLFALGVIPSETVTLRNAGGTAVEKKLADGTRVKIAPGAVAEARGADPARKVRQFIWLQAGEVEISAPKARPGEVAVRVETPEGMWVETVGTTFKVTRAWRNEKGETNVDKAKLTGVLTAVLLVAVSEGEVRTGNAAAEEARVAAGKSPVVEVSEKTSSLPEKFPELRAGSIVFVGRVCSADLKSAPAGTPERVYSRTVEYEVVEAIMGLASTEPVPAQRVKTAPRANMRIYVYISKDRPYIVPAKEGNHQLDPEFFKDGALHIVFCLSEKPNHVWAEHLALRTDGAVAALKALAAVSWGQAVNGLQAGLSTKQVKFEAGKPVAFDIHLKNAGATPLKIPGAGTWINWQFTFAPRSGGAPVLTSSSHIKIDESYWSQAASLAPGQTQACASLTLLRPDDDSWKLAGKLTPGKYSVTASFDTQAISQRERRNFAALDEWQGKVSTGPVEIEIVEPAKAAWGEAVNGLQGRLEPEKSSVAPGEDIKLVFWLRTDEKQKESLYVWDNIYSEGYRNDSYIVKTPDGKSQLIRRAEQNNWDKNVPRAIEIQPGVPWKLGGWAGEVNLKSLKELGLDTNQPGTYTITGVYEEAAAKDRFGPKKDVTVWGGKLTTAPIEVTVEATKAK